MVAPELEFYLTALNPDPDLPLTPPAGRSGRAETSPQPYGLEAITEYEDLIDDIYEYSEVAGLNVDTMIHEFGAAQLEINFLHGDPVTLADQVLVFKRIVRQVALSHGVYATFMAKPMEHQPGSAMHLHISVEDEAAGPICSPTQTGADSAMFRHFVGGLQTYLPRGRAAVRAQRQFVPAHAAQPQRPDQRAVGARQPLVRPARADLRPPQPAHREPPAGGRRQPLPGHGRGPDLRLPRRRGGGRAQPPRRPATPITTPRTLPQHPGGGAGAVRAPASRCAPCWASRSSRAFAAIKEAELEAFQGVISSWERDHLLLKV